MTPLETAGVVAVSILCALLAFILIKYIVKTIHGIRERKKLKIAVDEFWNNLQNDIKQKQRDDFFSDLERIKKENREENNE